MHRAARRVVSRKAAASREDMAKAARYANTPHAAHLCHAVATDEAENALLQPVAFRDQAREALALDLVIHADADATVPALHLTHLCSPGQRRGPAAHAQTQSGHPRARYTARTSRL